MLKIQNSLILVFTCALMSLAGCSSDADEGSDAKVVIGGLVDLTGDLASAGQLIELGIRHGEAEITAAGGIGGLTLEADVRDTQLDTDKAINMGSALAEAGAKAIVGEMASGISMAVATSVSKPNKIIQCSGSSTSPAISTHDDDGYLIRTILSDAYQGVILASLLQEEGHVEAAVIYIDNAYGSGLAEVFRTSFEAGGGSVTSFIAHAEGTADTGLLDQITDTTTALVVMSYDTGATFIQAAKSGTQPFDIYVSDGLLSDTVGQNLGTAVVEGIKGTAPSAPESADLEAFNNSFREQFGEDAHFFSGGFYDCTIAMALAIEKAGADADGPAIRDALFEVTNAPGEKIGYGEYAKAAELLGQGQDINYEGVQKIELDENGDTVRGVIAIMQFGADGGIETLSTQAIGD